MVATLSGKTAIITGASQGLGEEIARAYATAGANLLLAARDSIALKKLADELEANASHQQIIIARACDVTEDASARMLAATAERDTGGIHILVNNAGIWGPKGYVEEVDWSEWVYTLRINLLASVAMCRAVLPTFKRQQYGKIIQLSGGGATKPMPRTSAYAASKAAGAVCRNAGRGSSLTSHRCKFVSAGRDEHENARRDACCRRRKKLVKLSTLPRSNRRCEVVIR